MNRIYTLTFIFILAFNSLFAQADRTEIVVRFQPNINILNWQQKYFSQEDNAIQFKEIVSSNFNLALLDFDNTLTFDEVEKFLSKEKAIQWVTPNKVNVTSRGIPNDALYNTQWNMTDMEIESFWDKTTGGTTHNGDTIVLAIMESGTSLFHPDLINNFWHNYQESPGDGIDNDNNGYIDDFTGWNSAAENDTHFYDNHGTEITGVIGANGDNTIGVAGINWQVKLMPITFSKGNINTYFAAFDYLIAQRKLYNESNGTKGAFIVAVNESFGQDNTKPGDSPGWTQWCEYMDALGEVGILTIGATSNAASKDVDIVGDMPTTCPQDYLIAVTAINPLGTRLGASGATSIDLAAPGSAIPTTLGPTATYSSVGGTSLATPHVTGAVGLIYSYPCKLWADYIKTNPSKAALLVKSWIVESTKPTLSTNGVTVSGGRLNMQNIISKIDFYCTGNQLNPLNLVVTPTLTDGPIKYEFDTPSFGKYKLTIHNMLGQLLYTKKIDSNQNDPQEGTLNLDFLANGTYILSLTQNSQRVIQRIVKY